MSGIERSCTKLYIRKLNIYQPPDFPVLPAAQNHLLWGRIPGRNKSGRRLRKFDFPEKTLVVEFDQLVTELPALASFNIA